MSAPRSVMLFAAGKGTRMAPLTDRMPKPLISIAGRPLIDHALELIAGAGLAQVVVNTHYMPEMIEEYIANRNLHIVREVELLETGGGLRNALPLLGAGSVVTLNSDAVWKGPNPLQELLDAWRPDEMDALLMLVPRTNALGHSGPGDFDVAEDGRLSRAPGHVYTGTQIIKTERLPEIDERVFSLNLLWDMMAAEERLFGMIYSGQWCDVGQPESIALEETMLNV